MEDIYVPSTWKRLAAYLIDNIFVLLFYIPFAKTFINLFFSDQDVYISLWELLILFAVPAFYEFVFLVILQATPGKWLLDLKVVPAENPYEELAIMQSILRPLTSRLTFFFSWAIYAVAFLRYDRTHLCDWVAETRVIQFAPRPKRAGLRPVLAIFLICIYTWEGVVYSMSVLDEIEWANKRVELRSLLDAGTNMEFEFGDQDDED